MEALVVIVILGLPALAIGIARVTIAIGDCRQDHRVNAWLDSNVQGTR